MKCIPKHSALVPIQTGNLWAGCVIRRPAHSGSTKAKTIMIGHNTSHDVIKFDTHAVDRQLWLLEIVVTTHLISTKLKNNFFLSRSRFFFFYLSSLDSKWQFWNLILHMHSFFVFKKRTKTRQFIVLTASF